MIIFIEELEKYEPTNDYSKFIKQYFLPILRDGTKKYIKNIDVSIKILDVNGTLIPLSIGNKNDNCYTTSLSGTFKYLIIELKLVKNIFLKSIIYLLSKLVLFVIKLSNLDNIIFINNLLLSTNLYPKLSKTDLFEIKEFLLNSYPNYSILYRSINDFDGSYIDNLSNIGFDKIISRQIYISESKFLDKYLKIRDVKNDKKNFEKCNYIVDKKTNYNSSELKEILDCYNNLYIKKYTQLNPQFTSDFISNISKNNNFSINILKNKYNIKAVFGYYNIGNSITTPIFGYKDENLYRHISYLLLTSSLKKAKILNQSSGVGQFKINRGAKKHIEYSLVYYKNIPLLKRIIWHCIIFISKTIGEPNLKNNIY